MDPSKILHIKYDHNGNIIYQKFKDGEERWTTYDDRGNILTGESTTGFKFLQEYDDRDLEIHRKMGDGKEYWFDHDDDGKLIRVRTNFGIETVYKYDEYGREIHRQRSDGGFQSRKYDSMGHEIYFHDSDSGVTTTHEHDKETDTIYTKQTKDGEFLGGYVTKIINKNFICSFNWQNKWDLSIYDNDDREIITMDSENNFTFTAYDKDGNIIYYIINGIHTYGKYDELGRNIYSIASDGFEEWLEYDDGIGVLLSYKNSNGHEFIGEIIND